MEKGFIHKFKNLLSGKCMFPVTVTDAIYHGDRTQSSINDELLSRNARRVLDNFYGFMQMAHRGVSDCPENTMPAYIGAHNAEFTSAEVDVRVTSDGKFVAIHDATINRTSNGTGWVNQMTYAQLLSYDFGSWKAAQYAGTKIPLILDVALYCKAHNMMLELDVAGRLTEAQMLSLYDTLKHYGCLNNVDFCGYESELLWLAESGRTDTAVSVSFLNQTPTPALVEAISSEIDKMAGVNVSINAEYLSDSLISTIHGRGYRVKTWTISSEADYKNVVAAGADAILVNAVSPYEYN